jgi:uncharacterized phage protein (TIGR01671 family)
MKNRVIKFRAWDNGEMFYQSDKDEFTIYNIEKLFSKISGVAILMQFTGLTDKNGVEIFEGDVVKWDDDSDGKYWRVCEIRWVKSGFQLFGHTFYSKAPNEKKPIHFRFGQFIYEYDGALEVIGNIYQTAHSEIGKDGGR